jgi:hypothetical protein
MSVREWTESRGRLSKSSIDDSQSHGDQECMRLSLIDNMVLCLLETDTRAFDWLLVMQVVSIPSQIYARSLFDEIWLNAQVSKPESACREKGKMKLEVCCDD